MKIANNLDKYAVVIEQYLHSILDISDQKHWQTLLTLGASIQTYIQLFQFLKWSKVHFFNNVIANISGQSLFQVFKRRTNTKPSCPENKYEVCGGKKATKKPSYHNKQKFIDNSKDKLTAISNLIVTVPLYHSSRFIFLWENSTLHPFHENTIVSYF